MKTVVVVGREAWWWWPFIVWDRGQKKYGK
jgi:hypothetical protein